MWEWIDRLVGSIEVKSLCFTNIHTTNDHNLGCFEHCKLWEKKISVFSEGHKVEYHLLFYVTFMDYQIACNCKALSKPVDVSFLFSLDGLANKILPLPHLCFWGKKRSRLYFVILWFLISSSWVCWMCGIIGTRIYKEEKVGQGDASINSHIVSVTPIWHHHWGLHVGHPIFFQLL